MRKKRGGCEKEARQHKKESQYSPIGGGRGLWGNLSGSAKRGGVAYPSWEERILEYAIPAEGREKKKDGARRKFHLD